MKDLYKSLYETCTQNPIYLDQFKNAAHFVAMKGENYDSLETKLLIVGRSSNNWSSLDVSSADEFGKNAESLFYDTSRWNWIVNENGKLFGREEGNLEKPLDKRFPLSTNPFWRYSNLIYKNLSGVYNTPDVWMKNIAWSNLYKVSPKRYKNNSNQTYIYNAQLIPCKYILSREIELLKPTHILFMTGFDWIADFKSCFNSISEVGKNKMGKHPFDIYIEGLGFINNIPAVIMCRPEYRIKDNYVRDAVKAFNHLERKGI